MSRAVRLATALVAFLCAFAAATAEVPKDSLPAELSLTQIPLGLAPRDVPKDNPLTEGKVRLGRRLFFDPILSVDGTVACATCHDPAHGFAGTTRRARGVGGKETTRNAPTLLNRAFGSHFFWDGREKSLEAQALQPIENPLEMGHRLADVVKKLEKDARYARLFQAEFADGVTATNLGRAIATFERVLLHGNSRVDRFHAGAVAALNEHERHGMWLFESRAGCWRCHSGPNFSDEDFHNTGVSWGAAPADLGRFAVTKQESDRGRFKTPTLRGVALTAPFMHDGSFATLEDVVAFYNRGGGKNPNLDSVMIPLGLSEGDLRDLVVFLRALSDNAGKAKTK